MKKILPLFLLVLGSLFFGSSVFAEESTEYGGWSEDEGYYQNDDAMDEKSGETSALRAASSPANHTSDIETKTDSGKAYERVIAKTNWPGKYHYSQAWYQHRVTGSKSHSNRVWGTGSTIAKSGWASASLTTNAAYQRKTSYGS